ncbi:MAG: phage major capsid protein [bacterium]|nr:phage major capsid protein [bacterium]
MERLIDLRELLAAKVKEAGELLDHAEGEGRDLNDEETQKWDLLAEEAKGLEVRITRLEEQNERVRRQAAAPGDPPPHTPTPDPDPQNRFATFGEQLQAIATAYMEQRVDPRLRRIEERATGLSEGVPHEGGFLVQKDFMTELIDTIYETGILLPRLNRTPIGPNANGLVINTWDETSRVDGSRYGGILAYWAAEAGAATASKPKLRQIDLKLQKLLALYYATDELLQDATALEAEVRDAFNSEMNFKADDAVINGTGAGQPLGILTSGALVTITKETGQAAATLLAENIEKMYARLIGKVNAVWLVNTDLWPQIFQLHHVIGTGGVPMFVPAGGISQAPLGTLLGRPIVEVEQCATLGTVGDIIGADLSKYKWIDKGAIQAASSIHVQFLTDEMTFRFVWRVNGQPKLNTALTPFKGTNTVSPFVALATRA